MQGMPSAALAPLLLVHSAQAPAYLSPPLCVPCSCSPPDVQKITKQMAIVAWQPGPNRLLQVPTEVRGAGGAVDYQACITSTLQESLVLCYGWQEVPWQAVKSN